MQTNNLNEWLTQINSRYEKKIQLGLDRVAEVAARLDLLQITVPVITVGGTNGKGSTVAGLEAIYLAAGYRVGAFTSPYLYRFNEIVRVQGKPVDDQNFITAFERIEAARGETKLTPFEFNTLAALMIFQEAMLDVVILEVGLGGRFDAVNIIDADVAIVTSIAIDHAEILGDTREKIAFEKAGIFRANRPVVCGDPLPPETLQAVASELNAPWYGQGQQFHYQKNSHDWSWQSDQQHYTHLPLPRLALQNMATVLMAVELLQNKLPVKREAIDKALSRVTLAGRQQTVAARIPTIVDVSHNPASASWLADYLTNYPCKGKTHAVFSMLKDKDITATIDTIKHVIDEWHIAPLEAERAASLQQLQDSLQQSGVTAISTHDSINHAYQSADQQSSEQDRIIVFGSFYTVASLTL